MVVTRCRQWKRYALVAILALASWARADWVSLAEESQDSLATVIALRAAPEGSPPEVRARLVGTGVFVSPSRLVTSTYVVLGAEELFVELRDGRRLPALLLAGDRLSRLALLELREEVGRPIDLGRMRDPALGEEIAVLGTSYGFPGKLARGIVNGLDRSVLDDDLPAMGTGFEISAQADPGMSGAPVLSAEGEVLGFVLLSTVPEAGSAHSPLDGGGLVARNLLLPESLPREETSGPPVIVANPLVVCGEGAAGRHAIEGLLGEGAVRWGRIGMSVAPTPRDLAAHYGLAEHPGAVVTSIAKGGPAEAAGLAVGDLLLAMDGQPLASGGTLLRRVLAEPEGSVRLSLLRDGKRTSATVRLGAITLAVAAPAPAAPVGPAWLGVVVARTSPQLASQLGLEPGTCVSILSVAEGSPAAKAGLRRGDVLTRAGDAALTEPEALETLVGLLAAARPGETLRLELLSEGASKRADARLSEAPDRYARFPAGFDADMADL